jgi:hypothetical protein
MVAVSATYTIPMRVVGMEARIAKEGGKCVAGEGFVVAVDGGRHDVTEVPMLLS